MDDGIVLINTGPGKGKTTAALGVTLRALGYGQKVVFLQFIKSAATGESRFLEKYASEHPTELHYARLGLGFVGNEPSPGDKAKAEEAMAEAFSRRQGADLVVLDEINVALDKGMIPSAEVKRFILEKPAGQSLVLTGRGCPDDIIELAQTVTCMTEVKHAYKSGIKALRGVDF
jgi:cob(I)alamin adenosyltransferase